MWFVGVDCLCNCANRAIPRSMSPQKYVRACMRTSDGIECTWCLQVGISPFAEGEPLANVSAGFAPPFLGILEAGLANPAAPPELGAFEALKAEYLDIFDSVFDKYSLDALVYPQAFELLPENFGTLAINATTVSEINIMGIPGMCTLPLLLERFKYSALFLSKNASVQVACQWHVAACSTLLMPTSRSHCMCNNVCPQLALTQAWVFDATSCFAGVTVPGPKATTDTGAPSPFSLIFVGPANSEALLLALAYDYEQATGLRYVPELQADYNVPELASR